MSTLYHFIEKLGHEIASEDDGSAFDEVGVDPENRLRINLQMNVRSVKLGCPD